MLEKCFNRIKYPLCCKSNEKKHWNFAQSLENAIISLFKKKYIETDGWFSADWHRSLWTKCIVGHQFAHRWWYSSMWSHSHYDIAARFGWRRETSSSHAVFRILFFQCKPKENIILFRRFENP